MPDEIQLSHLEQTAYFAALRQGMHVLDVERIRDLVAVSPTHAAKLLAAMARKGALQRVGRGRYVVVSSDVLYGRQSFVADPFQVVDERRPINWGRAEILFVQVQRAKFFGIQEIRYHDAFFRISDREKTLLDCLERFDLCGGMDEVVHTISVLLPETDPERLLAYVPMMVNQALVHRLGYILEKLSTQLPVPETLLDSLATLIAPRVYPLDPHGPGAGPAHPRWRVRENLALELRG